MDTKLKQLAEEYESILLSRSFLDKLEKQLISEKRNLIRTEKEIEQSEEELNQTDFGDIVKNIFSKDEDSLKKERHSELLATYDLQRKAVESTEYKVSVLKEKIAKQSVLRKQLEQILANTEDLPNWSGTEKLDEILFLIKTIHKKDILRTRVKEALEFGEKTLYLLIHSLSFLKEKYLGEKKSASFYNLSLSELETFKTQWIETKTHLLKYEEQVKKVYEYIQLGSIINIDKTLEDIHSFYENTKSDFTLPANLKVSMDFIQSTLLRVKQQQTQFSTDSILLSKELDALKKQEEQKTIHYEQWKK